MTWKEKQEIWIRIRNVYELDKRAIGREYNTSNMLEAYKLWASEYVRRFEKEGAEIIFDGNQT